MKEPNQLNGKLWVLDTAKNFLGLGSKFSPERSLAYLMYKEKIVSGAAIIHELYALSIGKPLEHFETNPKKIEELKIGMGAVTFDPKNDNVHHNVKKVDIGKIPAESPERWLAIIAVSSFTRILNLNQPYYNT